VIDSHCHIAGEEFTGDLADVTARARAAGLAGAMVILASEDAAEVARMAAVSAAWPAVVCATGIHPHSAGHFAADPAASGPAVAAVIDAQPRCRAVGEIGLDYHYDLSPRDVQREVFRHQIRLARARRLPIVIHSREAEADTFDILAEEAAGEVGGVFHCFTGDRAMARRALDAGFHISLSGIATFPKAPELREVAKIVPADRLLIETDSPFLSPIPHRGSRNEPARVVHVAEVVAHERGVPVAELASQTTTNFERLFGPVG
jgi:TatD DNase family protein